MSTEVLSAYSPPGSRIVLGTESTFSHGVRDDVSPTSFSSHRCHFALASYHLHLCCLDVSFEVNCVNHTCIYLQVILTTPCIVTPVSFASTGHNEIKHSENKATVSSSYCGHRLMTVT